MAEELTPGYQLESRTMQPGIPSGNGTEILSASRNRGDSTKRSLAPYPVSLPSLLAGDCSQD